MPILCLPADDDKRALVYLLDRLCEYEEGIIKSCTLDGLLLRNDALSARAVMQSRRVLRRAQKLMMAAKEA